MENRFNGRGILVPNEGSNYKVLNKKANQQGQAPQHKRQKIDIPAGAEVQFQVIHPTDGNSYIIYTARVFRAQHTPHVHTAGLVIYAGTGIIAVNLGPKMAEINHPVLGKIQYIPT